MVSHKYRLPEWPTIHHSAWITTKLLIHAHNRQQSINGSKPSSVTLITYKTIYYLQKTRPKTVHHLGMLKKTTRFVMNCSRTFKMYTIFVDLKDAGVIDFHRLFYTIHSL